MSWKIACIKRDVTHTWQATLVEAIAPNLGALPETESKQLRNEKIESYEIFTLLMFTNMTIQSKLLVCNGDLISCTT